MAMKVTYTTINGQFVHEYRCGMGHFLALDPSGIVVATTDREDSILDEFPYWPGGEVFARVSNAAEFIWGFRGSDRSRMEFNSDGTLALGVFRPTVAPSAHQTDQSKRSNMEDIEPWR